MSFSNLTFEKMNNNFIINLDIEWLGFMQKFWTFMAYVFRFSFQKVLVIWSSLSMAKNFTLIHGNSKFQPFYEFYLMLKVTDVTRDNSVEGTVRKETFFLDESFVPK